MKNTKLRKALSVFLSVLILMSCWVWVASTDASAAGSYYVRVYLNIYDGANSDGYGKAYSVVDDINSEFYGKPNEYKWDYGSSWNAFDNSDGYDGEVNMAGFTLFYDNDKKYKAYDLSADLVAATTTLGNNWTSMDDLTLENFAAWPNKVEKVYSFNLDSMPSSLFWINDENNAVNGETSFGIHKITVAESSTSQEHILWTGLSGSESYYECYYGTITPTGLITPWDDCPGEATKTFYKDYTTSAVGTWIDPFNAGDYNVYPVNNYLSGGVSATFTVGSNGAQTNIDYIELGNTNNYYINFTNHSTQTATITALNSSNLVNGYSNNLTIAPGETKSFTLKKASMSGDGNYYNFCFKYTLNNVFEKNGTTPVEFYQAAYIGTWNTSDDSSVIGPPTSSEANSGFTVYNGTDMDFMNQFMADTGIFETVSTTGNRTSNIKFKYNYYLDNTDTKYTNWSQTGLRMYVKKWTYNVTVYFQPDTNDGTMNLVGSIGNEDTASLSIADMVYSYSSPSDTFKTPDSSNRPWAYYNRPCVPQWARSSSMEWGTVTSNSTVAYFRFCGNIFEGSKNSSEPGIIRFTDMKWKSTNNNVATFNGDINVYVFDKTDLRNYVRNIGELGANWAPMRNRFNDTQWNAYENALSNAMTVLANQKTNQKAVTDAYNNLVSACEALKSTANLTSQVAEVTYTKRIADYNSEATDTTSKYLIMPIGTETAVPAYDTYKHTTSGTVVAKQSSNLKTNFTQYETGINPIDYRYWKIDFADVDEALTAATNLLNTPLEEYKDTYYEEVQVARTTLSSIDRDSDTYYPTHQSDVTDALAELNILLVHNSTEAGAHEFIEDANGNYVIKFDETTHWYECEVCGYKYDHNEHSLEVSGDDSTDDVHTVECTYVDNTSGNTCDFVMTESHIFINPELARPTDNDNDGVWENGTYTYTCVCGAKKTEPAVRADYSELTEAIQALEGIKDDENLSDDEKTAINNAIADGKGIAQNLVTAEQDQIDKLVKKLEKIKADADKAIENAQLGVKDITEATSGVRVQFVEADGFGEVDSVQLGKDEAFKIRVANGNADSNITITNIQGEGVNTTGATLKPGESADYGVTMPTTAGIKEYTITYTIDGLKNADGTPVTATTKAYIYVKDEKYTPEHIMDEDCANGSATAEWIYTLEAAVGDFAPVYENKAPYADFGNTNLKREKALGLSVYNYYDYEDSECYAEPDEDKGSVHKGDAHAATYRYYIDTSLASTWEKAIFKANFAETLKSNYDNATLKYIRLANNEAYLKAVGEDKTFSVILKPGESSNVPTHTWTTSSVGDEALTVSHYDNSNENDYIFSQHLTDDTNLSVAYSSFYGEIPKNTESAKMMFSHRLEYNKAREAWQIGAQAEATTMTTHLYITSYDKAALREAVEKAEQAGYNSAYFNAEKYEAYENALKTAKEVLGKAETNQGEIDAATAALNTAIENLTKAENEAKFVLTVTHSIHENDKDSAVAESIVDYYLLEAGEFLPALNAEIIARDTINKYDAVATINVTADTEHTYNYWYIDYSGVQDAIDAAQNIIDNADKYDPDFVTAVTNAKNALEVIKNGESATTTPESQDDVDNAIKAVTNLTGHGCADKDTDHDCDICGATIGTHEDVDPEDHNCDYCGGKITDCVDADNNHKCDVCDATLSECADKDKNHKCDLCGTTLSECADNDKDHKCDFCGATLSECADEDKNHKCDLCGTTLSECADNDKDHKCDICGATLSECADNDKNHNCDICGTEMGTHEDVDPKDHNCDYCGGKVTDCVDADTDHDCDICGTEMGTHADTNNDHNCEYCNGKVTDCVDSDKNHKCDICDATMGTHADSATDNDHVCDYGCGAVLEDCVDADTDHDCDICGTPMGAHTDSATDGDHVCDYGCGETLENCTDVDTDTDHNCDICGAENVTSHNYVNPVLTRPTKNEDGTWKKGYYTSTCNCGATTTTAAERADYTEFDKALEQFEGYLENDKLTDAVKEQIEEIVNGIKDGTYTKDIDGDGENDVRLDYVKEEQNKVDALTELLNELNAEIKNDLDNDLGQLTKPDYNELIAEYEEYLELVKQYGGEVTYGTEGDPLTATVVKDGYIKDATSENVADGFEDILEIMNDPEANKAGNQQFISGVKEKLASINDGIIDGTLRDPNFEAYDAEVKRYNEETSTVNVSNDDEAIVEAAMAIVDAIKANPDATAKDRDAIIATQTAIIKGINDKYADCVAGTHDYADATCTAPKTCKLCGATDGSANGHDWSAWTFEKTTTPTKENVGTYTRTCSKGDATETKSVARENYSAYDEAIKKAEELLKKDELTQAAKDLIEAAITEAKKLEQNLPEDVVENGETIIDNDSAEKIAEATGKLNEVLNGIVDEEGNLKDEYKKPDTKAAEDAVEKAEALEGKIELPADVKTQIENLRTELDYILDKISKDDNATEAEYKDDLKKVEDAANVILNKYAACEKDGHKFGTEVIATYPVYDEETKTWSQGTYTKTCSVCGYVKTIVYNRANYEAYDKALADLNALLANDNITEATKTEIREVINKNTIRNDLMTPDQDKVTAAADALKAEVDKITNDATGAYEKVDYTNYNAAVNAYNSLVDVMSDADKTAVEAIKTEIAKIPADGSKKDYQTQVDKAAADIAAINGKYGDCATGNHVDTDHNHNCDICGTKVSECTDTDTDHDCDICGTTMGTHEDVDPKDHNCDYCGGKITDCVDTDKNHKCDICGVTMGTHEDVDPKDHNCDYCDGKITDCADTDKNHKCDICDTTLSECADTDKNHKCDICGTEIGTHADTNNDHNCEYCNGKVTDCVDADTDHDCDICGTEMGTHADTNNDHNCEYCNGKVTDCVDADTDHDCDICGTEMGTHADTNNDHNCEYCNGKVTDCLDADTDHDCDICGTPMGAHADSATDSDHVCDYGCGETLENCTDVDTDTDHNCDICGKADVTSHEYVNPVLTRPIKNEDGTWNKGYYTSTCNCGDTTTTEAERATYTAYDEAKSALESLLTDKTITDAAKAEIEKILADNEIEDNRVSAEQSIVDAAANALKAELEKLTNEDGSLKDEYKKPDAECTHTDCAEKVVAPTCHSLGYTLHVCKSCGYAYRTDEQPATDDHKWGRWFETESGSCLEYRMHERSCLNEGCYEKQIEIMRDANGDALYGKHYVVVIKGQAATCVAPGYTDYERCVICGEITEAEVIPATGHIDNNKNGNCDVCNYVTNPSIGKCDCLCHNDSFFGKLLYNFVNFFWKLFKIQQGCQCGAQHW